MDLTQTIRAARDWVPILMLHEVVPDSTRQVPAYAVTQSRLRVILSDFTGRGYRSGTLEDVVRRLSSNASSRGTNQSKGKRFVLTFDDGTSDFLEYALPVLQEFDATATLFIVAGMVGGDRAWHSLPGQPPLEQVPLMSEDELRMLQSMGFTIGAHTMSHPSLTELSTAEAREEIVLSRRILSDLLGSPVQWFAYPYLAANGRTRSMVREAGYEGACGGPNQSHTRFYLNRVDAAAYTGRELRLRCNGPFNVIRHAVRRVRHKTKSGEE